MVDSLSGIATSQPHAALAAYIHGLVHKFTFLGRTTPNIEQLLHPLEECIRAKFIPSVCGRTAPNDLERDLLALPPRLGGVGVANPALQSASEFSASLQTTHPLVILIQNQCPEYPLECIDAQTDAKKNARHERQDQDRSRAQSIRSQAPPHLQRAIELAQEKGASSWLTTVPLKEHKFVLHKRALQDALALRYGWSLRGVPTHCACGALFSVEHELSCAKGGFTIVRHNEVRDLTANLLSEVCHNVCTEPSLQPLTGEQLTSASAITNNAAGYLVGRFVCMIGWLVGSFGRLVLLVGWLVYLVGLLVGSFSWFVWLFAWFVWLVGLLVGWFLWLVSWFV